MKPSKDFKLWDCPYCGSPKRISSHALNLWMRMMVKLGMKNLAQSEINKLRRKRKTKPKTDISHLNKADSNTAST